MSEKTKKKAIRVTHTLYRPQLKYLDRLAYQTSQRTDKGLKRSIIIRVLIDILKESKPMLKNTSTPFAIQNEIESTLKNHLRKKLK